MIRPVSENDAPAICAIYNHYVEKSVISFEEEAVSVDEMVQRIKSTTAHYPWLVFEENGKVLGYAYVNLWKTRCAYRNTLESTIYTADSAQIGTGTKLYNALFNALDPNEIHSLIAVIALPNPASVNFHEKMGFKKAGHFKEVGYKLGKRIDVGYWQKMLDSKS